MKSNYETEQTMLFYVVLHVIVRLSAGLKSGGQGIHLLNKELELVPSCLGGGAQLYAIL